MKAKPDKLRKELYEIISRKRIFLTDRLERLEKLLMVFGVVTVEQMAEQQMELMERVSVEAYREKLKQALESVA